MVAPIHTQASSEVTRSGSPGNLGGPTGPFVSADGLAIRARSLYPIEGACSCCHVDSEVGKLVHGQHHGNRCAFYSDHHAHAFLAALLDALVKRDAVRIEGRKFVFPLTRNLGEKAKGKGLGGACAEDETDVVSVVSLGPSRDAAFVFPDLGCPIVRQHSDCHETINSLRVGLRQ